MIRRKLFLLFFFCLTAAFSFGQSQTATAQLTAQAATCTPAAPGAACLILPIGTSTNTVAATLGGTFSGTLQFEGSGDNGATWVSVAATPSSGGSTVTSATGTGTWQMAAGGYTYLRIRCSSYSSGTVIATLNPSKAVAAGLGGGGTVSSVTFTGDGTVLSSTPSSAVTSSGTLTAALQNAGPGTLLGNGNSFFASPSYSAQPTLGAVSGAIGQITYLGSTSGSLVAGCTNATCTGFGSSATPALFKSYFTGSNCAAVGTGAQPSVASCGSATAGRFSCSTSATSSCQVNTTAVTGASNIIVIQTANTAVGTALSVTCNTSASTLLPMVISQSTGVSFTIQLTQPVTNPDCFTYFIID